MNPQPQGYRLVRLPNGATGVFAAEAGEMFHPAVGPEAEAQLLYVEQLRLRERFQTCPSGFVVWDVGLGAAGNAMAAALALADLSGTLQIESFDRTAGALLFALEHPEAFPKLATHAAVLCQLAEHRAITFRMGCLDIEWRLHLGDFPALMRQANPPPLAKPHAIFWDPHSPARNPEMWTLRLFEDVFRALDPSRACLLATYSRSTLVRTALLLAGFYVGSGVPVGAKEETTVAANAPGWLRSPLDRSWVERIRRSGSAEPLRSDVYRQEKLAETTASELRRHPQFIEPGPPAFPSPERLARWFDLPLYRERWRRQGYAWPPDAKEPARPGFEAAWDRIPFLSKADLREDFPRNFLADGQSLEGLLEAGLVEVEYTSGTAGERAAVLFGRGWWDEQEQRALRLNSRIAETLNTTSFPRRAVVTTPACNGLVCPSKWVPRTQRTLGPALYVNQARIPFLLKEEELEQMAHEIADWAPIFLDVDPVHGAWLALFCERRGIRFPSVRFVVASYEFVSVVHRRILERVFGVPVFNLYGSTETGHLLMEDVHGVMRPCAENAFLEVPAPDADGIGDLVVTTLTNELMPLVRYRIGDLVERREVDGKVVHTVHGRTGDAIRGSEGARVTTWQVDACFADVEGLMHYQLRQAEGGDALLRYVPDAAAPQPATMERLVARLERLLGTPGALSTESVALLPPTPSGKFRLTERGKD